MRRKLDLAAVDLSELGELLGSRDYGAGYFDPETGEIHRAFDGEVIGEDGDPVDRETVDWLALGGGGSHDAYRDMEIFAVAVADRPTRLALERALDGPKPFRRFRDEIYRAADDVRRSWHEFQEARCRLRAVEWLHVEGLVSANGADQAVAAIESESDEVLASVRGLRRPVPAVPVDIRQKVALSSEHWSPKVVARLNDYEIKLAKLKGEFVWHTHDETDELFLVVEGSLTIQFRDGDVTIGPGQLYVVPRGVEHRPVTDGEVAVMLIEPAGVVNTGEAGGELTASYDDSLLD